MKLKEYLKDKLYLIISFIVTYLIIILLLLAFKIDSSLIIAISLLLFFFVFIIIIIEYYKKKKFYTNLLVNIERLDKAYLVLETLEKPNFYDGELLYQAIYEINKSMNETVKLMEDQIENFKQYIEIWIHEVKIPIATLVLIVHNHSDKFDKKVLEQLRRIEDYVEQVLYYVRSENAEKDYLINEVSLNKVVSNIVLKNKDDLLENKINLDIFKSDVKVYTDSKWLEFILGQIINNSIKYKKDNTDSYIKIDVKIDKDKKILIIEDNGIGIPASDISKVFEKSFTGQNGRIKAKSTGMGLFIVKNLCEKLGHKIEVESKKNEYTRVFITFGEDKYYNVVR